MAKDPAFLFYSADFLTGVSDLTYEERGQYITLLCLQHQKGRLSRKIIEITIPNATADVLSKFKKDENGNFFNERLEKESKKRAQHAEKQRQRAIKGWKKRKEGQSPDIATANATALPLENENENVIINRNEDVNEIDERLSNLLYELILKNNPNHKQPNFKMWCKHFRLMRERDNRTPQDIELLIHWSQQDPFWHTNILSPAKLRIQFDRLILQCKKDAGQSAINNSNKLTITPDDFNLTSE